MNVRTCECDLRDRLWNGYGKCLRCGAAYVDDRRNLAASAAPPAIARVMKCSSCQQTGHNRTTCPNNQPVRVPAADLMRLLIDPMHAVTLVTEGKVGETLANATRRIGDLRDTGLMGQVSDDILRALAELELRARGVSPGQIEAVRSTALVLSDAQQEHARAAAAVLNALGYPVPQAVEAEAVTQEAR